MLLFIDTETGGLNPDKHSLLQVAMQLYDGENEHEPFTLFIKHEEYVVTEEAMRINGLSLSDINKYGFTPTEAVSQILSWIREMDLMKEKPTLAGHNIHFDRRFLQKLFRDGSCDLDNFFSYRTLDTASVIRFLKDAEILPADFPDGLHDAAKALGIRVVDAHTAIGDVRVNIQLYKRLKQLVRGEFQWEECLP
ncbi:3'-5' exonuclease [Alicyclobacillus shizuokensis]|uniref:3'-5' exonuclease n=1 Tax=Alicyclobacillus shizuokensis TaxID=392014 RepID=UPI00082E11D0|nr:3'-5' exonuclease [Alicyclobacillus shizuokensis]